MDELTVHIQRMAFGSRAVGRREDGKVVLVQGGVPGETVLARPTRETSGFLEAEVLEVLEASPQRGMPVCPAFPRCGGCSWMHLSRTCQVQSKSEQVQMVSRRLKGPVVVPLHCAGGDIGWRHRARIQMDTRGDGRLVVGFFAEGTHDVVSIRGCPVCVPPISRLLERLSDWEPPESMQGSMDVVTDEAGGLFAALYSASPLQAPDAAGQALFERGELAGLTLAAPGRVRGQWGMSSSRLMVHRSTESRIPVFPGAFTQANLAVNEVLIDAVLAALREHSSGDAHGSPSPLLELYAGHGNFSLPLARQGHVLTAVEAWLQRQWVEDVPGLAWYRGTAKEAVSRWVRQKRRAGAVLLDPPRTGAAEVMADIGRLAEGSIVYVSCNPATFHRDAGVLLSQGWQLVKLDAFDMMPHTFHVELLGVFARGDSQGHAIVR
jgi:23S rRNA (uracil1939-C5)-methyltransferase